MVKPPKTMQPEQVDEKALKAGRTSGSSFSDSSFHNYMARKIAVQRQQFGVLLPPPPQAPQQQPSQRTNEKKSECHQDKTPQTSSSKLLFRPSKSSLKRNLMSFPSDKENNTGETTSSAAEETPNPNCTSHTESHRQRGNNITFDQGTKPPATSYGTKIQGNSMVRSMLMRLKRRHGTANKRKLQWLHRHRKRRQNCGTPSSSSIVCSSSVSSIDGDVRVKSSLEWKAPQETEMAPKMSHFTELDLRDDLNQVKTSSTEKEGFKVLDVTDDPPTAIHNDIPALTNPERMTSFVESSDMDISSPSIRKQFRPDLFFYGIVIKVQGFTDPDEHALRRLIQKHGGDYETYETSRVTHIIASAMSTAKENMYKKRRKPTPVCIPSWIVDSAQAGELLPHGKYLLNKEENQKEIEIMFQNQTEHKGDHSQPREVIEIDETEMQQTPPKDSVIIYQHQKDQVLFQTPTKLYDTARLQNTLKSLGRTDNKLIDGKIRSVGTDPDFVEMYFKSSRLSFIGSYRQRMTDSNKTRDMNMESIPANSQRFIFHIDMDQFFAAVVLRNFPQYRNKPVAISHHGIGRGDRLPSSNETKDRFKNSTSECATVNYEARKFGIKKGMFLSSAFRLCPELIVLNYDFNGYEAVSQQVREILGQFCKDPSHPGLVEPMSCDEYIMEIHIDPADQDVKQLAEEIRIRIHSDTECTASIGIGKNKFLAKLACDKAKPNGCCLVEDHKPFLTGKLLRDFPGVGWRSDPKLKEAKLCRVDDVWELGSAAISILRNVLGEKNGMKIYNYCHGEDDRSVQSSERKTVGAECNYGVRFDGPYGIDHFVHELAKEVERRMLSVGVKGSKCTLKVKKRKENAKEPPKFLGHGSCHNLSKSTNLPGRECSRSSSLIAYVAMSLFHQLGIENIHDVRGMGIIMSDLQEDSKNAPPPHNVLQQWLTKPAAKENGKRPRTAFQLDRTRNSIQVYTGHEDATRFKRSKIHDTSDDRALRWAIRESLITANIHETNRRGEAKPRLAPLFKSYSEKSPQSSNNISNNRSKILTNRNEVKKREKRVKRRSLQKVDLFHDDLTPLREFVKKNSTSIHTGNSNDFIIPLLTFFTIVLAERPANLRPMIRMMSRQNQESERCTETIVSVLDKLNLSLRGSRLDMAWLLAKT